MTAHKNLKDGNVTAAVSNILTVLDWEFIPIALRGTVMLVKQARDMMQASSGLHSITMLLSKMVHFI